MRIEHNIPQVTEGLGKAQGILERSVARYLDRAAMEVTREARRLAPKAFSTLTNSISAYTTGPHERLVMPAVNYARAVEEGTGPAAGKARYFPSWIFLAPWVKQKSRITFSAKWGSARRRSQEAEVRDRAFALARYIHEHGTKAQPYMAPAAANMKSRVIQLLDQGVKEGIAEIARGTA